MRVALFCIGLPVFLLGCVGFACYYLLEWKQDVKSQRKITIETRSSGESLW